MLPSMTSTRPLTFKQLEAYYKKEGALGVGAHYVVDRDGDVHKGRPLDEHPNVNPTFNKDSVAIEVMCSTHAELTQTQHKVIDGLVEFIKDTYPNAEELNHIM